MSDPIFTIKKEHIDSEFGELWRKGEGYQIKASDAIRLALIESDNTAAKVIATEITDVDFRAVYNALDIDLNADQQGALVSAKNYSSILKALYFSSVISKDSSESILDMLTKTKFPDKLAAGVPQNIMVAHKIGNFKDKDGNEGFRDCGIVYAHRRPYVLCMFSVGDEALARERMQLVSKMIYDYVSEEKEELLKK
jgi:beta-lactamase class A